MKNNSNLKVIVNSKNQLNLYGYNNYFNSFIKLFKNNKLPNTILFTGLKGLGKSTFAYHFINYLLSSNEDKKYSIEKFSIDPFNKSYLGICNNTHPNFYLLDNAENEENIKIDQVRNILKFLNKTTYNSNTKIVLIDNAEYLNLNSANALLKTLEEPPKNTFFFIIHNSSFKIPDTVKSRCVEFSFFFNSIEKREILSNLINQYDLNFSHKNLDEVFYYQGPGNLLRYMLSINEIESEKLSDRLYCISYLIDKYKKERDPILLNFISMLIEVFYSDLSIKKTSNFNIYFHNKFKIMKQFNEIKKYNLDKNNFFINLLGILKNET